MEGKPVLDGDEAPRRRRWLGAILGVALVAAGAGAWLLGQPSDSSTARVLGKNRPVNVGATEARDISANNSPALARNPIDPANLVVANRIDLPSFSCALNVSFNGGGTWEPVKVPFPAGEEDPPRCYAPDAGYAPDGTLHLSFVTLKGLGNVPNAVWTVSSRDGGRTLSTPVKAAGPLAFQVQLTTDTTQANRLYLTWLQAEATGSLLFPETGYPIVNATSIDGGATWSAPVRVSPPSRERVVAPSPALGRSGELYVLYLDLMDDRLDYAGAHEGRGGDPYDGVWSLVLARSTDGGATWQEALVDDQVRPTERFIVFLPPTPSLAVDPESGQLYVGFTDGRRGDADVHLWTSSDGGQTFSPPVRVNDTPERDGTSQYLPRLDVAAGGRVDVLYFDRREDQTNIFNEVSLQSSFDRGRTFTRRVKVSDRAFDSRIGQGIERNLPDLGSRLALVSTARRALAVWPDTRAGNQLTGKQDLASAVVDVPKPGGRSLTWLRTPGAVGMVLGLALLLLTLRSLRSGRPRRSRAGGDFDPSVARPAPAAKGRRSKEAGVPSYAAPLPRPLPTPPPAASPAPPPAGSPAPVDPPLPPASAPAPNSAGSGPLAPAPAHPEPPVPLEHAAPPVEPPGNGHAPDPRPHDEGAGTPVSPDG